MAKDRISNKSIPLLEDFKKWVEELSSENKKPGTGGNYCTWLKNVPHDIHLSSPLDDYLRIIGSLIMCGDRAHALSFLEIVCKKLKAYLMAHKSDALSNDQSALNKYKDYLFNGIDFRNTFTKCTGLVYTFDDEKLEKARQLIKKNKCYPIDSMRSLLAVVGEEQFIRMAIENSFFFSKDIVEKRSKSILNDQDLHTRWGNSSNLTPISNKDLTLNEYKADDGYTSNVLIDGGPKTIRKRDENFQVRKLIREYTGYELVGYTPTLKNYIISHIWGNATDPRYYTNFWNIVLVPAWANFLLDKKGNAPRGSFASILKATFMDICSKLYQMEKMNWKQLSMDQPKVDHVDDILHDSHPYRIQIINEKNNSKLGPILIDSITISTEFDSEFSKV